MKTFLGNLTTDYTNCTHQSLRRKGFRPNGKRRFVCTTCGKWFDENTTRLKILDKARLVGPYYIKGIKRADIIKLTGLNLDQVKSAIKYLRNFSRVVTERNLMKKLSVLMLLSLPLFLCAQSGQVVFTPPAPGQVHMVAGTITCDLTGNAVPATQIHVNCNVDGTIIAYDVPVAAGKAYTTQFNSGLAGQSPGDAVTFSFQKLANGFITWSAAATPNGGTTAQGSGNF